MVDPISRSLTPQAAAEIVALRADDETQRRIDELADKCNEGLLTPEEQAEYQDYLALFNVLTILQARAQGILAARNGQ